MDDKISRAQETEMRCQVSSWMEARGLPLILFDKLQAYNKILLHNRVCVGVEGHGHQELKGLYSDLGLLAARAEGSPDTEGHEPTYEQLEEYFSLSPLGAVAYQKTF